MVNFLVRVMNFLSFVTNLLAEDIMWLKDYCSSLSNWHCIFFIAYCVEYILLIKFIFILTAKGIKWLLSCGISSENMDSFAFNLLCANHAYLEGYDEGYRIGRTAREEALRKEREKLKRELDYTKNHPWLHYWTTAN